MVAFEAGVSAAAEQWPLLEGQRSDCSGTAPWAQGDSKDSRPAHVSSGTMKRAETNRGVTTGVCQERTTKQKQSPA